MPPIRSHASSGCLLALTFLAASGHAQSVLTTRLGTVPNSLLGTVTRAVGDQDGDGVTDFVVSEPGQSTTVGGRAFLISGATRATLATFQGQIAQPNTWGMGHRDVNPIGDVNGDGRGDFAIGYVNFGHLDVFSGLSGARLYRLGNPIECLQYACSVGDYDGDNRSDFAAFLYINGNVQLCVLRGVAGTQLLTLSAQTDSGYLRNVGDQNGDGFAEIVHVRNQYAEVYNLHPPGLLRRITLTGGGPGLVQIDLADWNNDGRQDLVCQYGVGGQPSVYVQSLATGALLRSYQLPGDLELESPSALAVLGDVDTDGAPDFAVRVTRDAIHSSPYGHIAILSGRTGARIGDWPGSAQFSAGLPLAGLGDVDGDGFPDFVMGNSGLNAGRGGWQVISGRGFAAMLVKPSNCYSGPFPPLLGMTRPVLGGTTTIAGRDAPVGTAAVLVLSQMPSAPTNLGFGGCDAWFDLGSGAVLGTPTTAPDWQLSFPLPNARPLVGLEIALQAYYVGTNTPLGYDLTNGLWTRLGY